jgi:hypothetical protein
MRGKKCVLAVSKILHRLVLFLRGGGDPPVTTDQEHAGERSVFHFINFSRSRLFLEVPFTTTSGVSIGTQGRHSAQPIKSTLNFPARTPIQSDKDSEKEACRLEAKTRKSKHSDAPISCK